MREGRRRRIAYVNHTGEVSGAEKVLLHMLHGLDKASYERVVLCPAAGDLQRMVADGGVPCIPTQELHARFTWRPDRLLRYFLSFVHVIADLRKKIRRIDPDFVHANTLRAGIATTLATMGTGQLVVWHVHDILPSHPISGIIRAVAYLSRRTRVIAVSHATANAFSGRLRFSGRVHVIHNGTDLSRFPMKQPGNEPLKRELGLSQDVFLVCAVGQICERKGLRELVEAFDHIHGAASHMQLAIVGRSVFQHEERYRNALIEQVARAGLGDRVHFTGERRDIAAVLQSADLLVLNSLQEPFGLVLVEAMSSGTPVLAARVGGIPEIVTDSDSGWLVEKGDTEVLAAKLLELSQHRDALGRVARFARETVCPQFSIERFLSRLDAFYSEIPLRPNTQWSPAMTVAPVRHEKGDQFV